ncbi:MAG: pyruvate kinase [Vicinamibacterales bacterium]|nr:pyruvate kinase [Vicinamibacterales bacterium]
MTDRSIRHTKIIATIGPASRGDEIIEQMIHAGVDICRLNFSHGTQEAHAETFRRIRTAAAKATKVVGILQDLSGPKIRTGRLKDGKPIELREGQTIRIVAGDGEGGLERIYTTYVDLVRNVRPGGRLLIDDGRIELEVVEAKAGEVIASVIEGGPLGEHKGINAPGVALAGAALTAKDIDDLRFGAKLGVDMVALSFVRSGDDVWDARRILTEAGAPGTPLIAKLERPEALEHLDDILKVSQGVMVARGDLGLEIPLEKVPTSQKEITRRARQAGVPVIVATQVLESMRTEPRPTRAEVSDAANAVDDGVDSIMLAGETAVGLYPVKTVETLDAVIREAERIGSARVSSEPTMVPTVDMPRAPHAQAVCEAAVTLADHCSAYAIVAITRLGNAARILSALRPRTPVFAATETDVIARHLTIYRGVHPLTTGLGKEVDTTGALLKEELRSRGLVPHGSVVVFMAANTRLERADQNFVNLQRFD